ncbi:MAG: hypothetical protein J6B75_04620 [Ruminococcus sp.]|nr:hypothetical protein [Ruminococcus sp.]
MAIRKDIDDMLNNLKSGKPLESPKNPEPKPIPKLSDSKIDKMSVDDLLSSLTSDKSEKKSVPEAAENKTEPKKKIVISHELPDYEAIREEEKRKEKERSDAEKQAERERIKAEREAEIARIEAEKKAAEEAEKARIEAEKKAAEKAEKARIEAEKARIEAEKKAAEEAEKARIEAEKKAAEEAEKARIEAEEKADEEEFQSDSFSEEAVAASSDAEIEEADESEESIEEVPKTKKRSFFKNKKAEVSDEDFGETADEPENVPEKKENKLTSVLKNILDEDPDEIIDQRKEQAEPDDTPRKGRFKKGFYAVFGVIFALLACVGLVTVIAKGIAMFGSYTSGESRKEGFEDVLYPAVIMDIESFNSPAELSSEQIITAAIWSMIMTDGVTEQYELTFDVVIIPAADVESYAVKLFGDNLPKLEHTTVGPAESRFYYNEETKSYNVPVAPVTYTYSPEIREASKSGNEYTVVVDYIDELPSWLPKTSSKSVQYVLTEVNGSYQLKSMKILSTNTNAV